MAQPDPVAHVTKLNGGEVDVARDLVYGERVIALVELSVSAVGLQGGKAGPVEHRALALLGLFELEGEAGVRTLNALKERARTAARGAGDAFPGLLEDFEGQAAKGAELVQTSATAGAIVTPEEAAALANGDGLTGAAEAAPDGEVDFPIDAPDGTLVEADEGLLVRHADAWTRASALPPFDGYDAMNIGPIVDEIETFAGVERADRARWAIAYEAAHKARKRLLDKLYAYATPLAAAPDLPPAGEAFGPSDDEVALGDEPDLDAQADDPFPETDPATGSEPDDELEVDDDDFEL